MDAESEIEASVKRWLIGGFGLLLLVTRLIRLWQWMCDGDSMTRDVFYKIVGGIVVAGYLLNATLLLRLMANY